MGVCTMLAKHFGLRLKYLRKVRNLTQAQLAWAADISVPYLGRVERGLSSPSFEIIQKISEALETEPANLFLPPGRGSADTENHVAEGAASPLIAPFSCTNWTRFGALLWELPEGGEHWSREFWQLLGYGDRARKNASTELLLQHVHQEHRPRVAAALEHACRGNPVNDLEFLLVRKDGERRDVVLHLDVIKDPRGNPRSLHGTAMDITEWRQLHAMLMVNQKELEAYVRERTEALSLTVAELKREMAAREQAEGALRDLAQLMRGMADNLPDLLWAKDLEGRFLFVNQAMCDVLLKAEDTQEPLGKTDMYFAQRERAAGHEHTFGEVCANSDEVTLRTLQPGRFLEDGLVRGQYLALDVHKAPFHDAGGALIGTVGAGRDVTAELAAREQAETTLRESEEPLKNILGVIPDFVSIVDRQYNLVWANSACFETFGPDILNRRCFEVFNDDKGEPCPDCAGRATFENGRPNTLERAVHLPDGRQRFLSWMSVPLARDEDGSVTRILHVGRDITDYRQAIVDLGQAKADAEAATRAKTHFLAAMSHDLRTPLNGALGMLQLLQATGLEPEQSEYLDNAILAARNLLTLLNEILDLAKVEAGRMEVREHEFSPRAFLETELRVLKAQAELKGLRFVLEVAPDVPQAVLTDQIRLGQILQNLVGNALKFTHKGELRVSCGALPGEGDACMLRFCVADTGPGIAESLRDTLFTPFVQGQQGQTAVKGSGLGLSIVKRLVELLGGGIEVHSTSGKGARFIFTIRARVSPLARQLAAAEASVAATMATATVVDTVALAPPCEEHAEPSLKRKVVLLVEDDDINRLAAERMLCSLGHVVLAACDGARALDILRELEVDLVLMDVRLPLLDGLAATQAIRNGAGGERNATVPIVALTALAMDGDRERCLEAGMDDYLAKPVEMSVLREALERFLGPERKKTPRTEQPSRSPEHTDD